ncbi:MAG: L-threonylcarbamoyladenylate synthase [Spirochaetota bacterium]
MNTEVLHLGPGNLEPAAGRTAEVLAGGGVCVIPTDTLYGLVALDRDREAVRRVYRIKQRPPDKPLIRLIGSLGSLGRYTDQQLPPRLRRYWPGPLTVVFRACDGGSIALRWPRSGFLQALFKLTGCEPLVAPSANLSGGEDIFDCESLVSTFTGQVELILCAEAGPAGREPSTIVDITGDRWRVLRAGAVKLDL